MEFFKVLILGIVISIITIFLKQIKPEFSVLCIVVGSLLLIVYIINQITPIFSFFNEIITRTGIDKNMFLTLLKIIGVGYLIEFSASICIDSGNSSIADKIVLAGKIMIFALSMPIITSLFNMIMELI